MKHLLDTNVWIDALAGRLSAEKFLLVSVEVEWAGYSAITRLELFGFPGIEVSEKIKIKDLLKSFEEVAVTSDIIDWAIKIREKSKVKVPDAIIAGTALSCGCRLVTRNVDDFKTIQGLELINPFKAE
jgi:predicted nucleic acid-binding protein